MDKADKKVGSYRHPKQRGYTFYRALCPVWRMDKGQGDRVGRVRVEGGAIHVGYTRKKNGDLAPVVWLACMARMPVMTVCSGVCSYARHGLGLRL